MAAIGAGPARHPPGGNMVVDIGGGTTTSLSSRSPASSIRTRCASRQSHDEAITNYLKRKYNLLIGERTAEQIKIEIGSRIR